MNWLDLARRNLGKSGTAKTAKSPPTAVLAVPPAAFLEFEELAAIAEYDGGLQRPHAELLAALETAPLGPEHDRAAIIEVVAMHLDRLAAAGIVSGEAGYRSRSCIGQCALEQFDAESRSLETRQQIREWPS